MSEILKTERVILRPFTARDTARVIEMLNDLDVSRWLARVPHPFTRTDLRLFDEDGGSRWPELAAIARDGDVIGAVSLRPDHLGYWLGAPFWGQGFGTEAVRAGCSFIFDTFEADQILSGVFEGNTASRRILEGLGFELRERNHVHCAALNCEMRNLDYRLTRARWQART